MAMASSSPWLLPHSAVATSKLPQGVEIKIRTSHFNIHSAINFSVASVFQVINYCRSSKVGRQSLVKPISAAGSGLEASITDPAVTIKDVEIVVESRDEEKMQVRVDLSGKETQIVFDKILRNLARTAPPVPGFRREKGGKTSKVPKDFLLQILGEERVTNFVIQEIITSTVADFVEKENLSVKDNKINTIQTADELKSSFVPGSGFGFNATLELEKATENSS